MSSNGLDSRRLLTSAVQFGSSAVHSAVQHGQQLLFKRSYSLLIPSIIPLNKLMKIFIKMVMSGLQRENLVFGPLPEVRGFPV